MGSRRSPFRPGLGIVLLALVSCADESPTSTFELAGYVREVGDGPGVRGATVTFTSDTRYTTSTRTNSDGYYEMAVETDGEFGQVRAEHEGYQPAEETVFFDTRQRRVDLVVVPLSGE
ncbi:MAG: carboxypeptidase regulatory-like domain-containing protein [Polyangiales bacterium]